MKPTEQLKEEHRIISSMLKILEMICKKLESGGEVSTADLKGILEFIKIFVDRCHHAKEEDLLFTAMEEIGISKRGGPIGVMLMEHNTGRDYVKNMSDAIEKYKEGDKEISLKIVENAKNYIALLSQHIEKEDNILYPMAETRLSANKQEELLEKFEKIEKERIGSGRHEEFHKLLHQLKEVYL